MKDRYWIAVGCPKNFLTMRSIDEVTELSYESFIETYGRVNGDYHQAKGT